MKSNSGPHEFELPSRDVVSAAHIRIVVVAGGANQQLCEKLQSFGFEVYSICNADEVIPYLTQVRDINGVIFDMQLLIAGGIAILSQLCSLYPQIPVITMSDAMQLGLLRQSTKLGAAEYLVTPIDPELLRKKCANVFFHQKSLAAPSVTTYRATRPVPRG